ncbi:MAG: DUF1801 domain-containing protein [Sphingobacteriaceae bacterium]|nr:DUF1801 domain-containing protein [Sphingobacteriaceae bacterium]MBK7816763.1 DUF1801 domain-containing protein [Sphingobacteriaceae bacterium]
MKIVKAKSVEGYIDSFPDKTQKLLKQVRKAITAAAPKSVEDISYGMPAYKLNGKPLVYFGGYEKHIGFYATPTGHKKFEKQLSKYKQGKGSVQFPLEEAMPLKLITDIVKFRITENNAKYAKKK